MRIVRPSCRCARGTPPPGSQDSPTSPKKPWGRLGCRQDGVIPRASHSARGCPSPRPPPRSFLAERGRTANGVALRADPSPPAPLPQTARERGVPLLPLHAVIPKEAPHVTRGPQDPWRRLRNLLSEPGGWRKRDAPAPTTLPRSWGRGPRPSRGTSERAGGGEGLPRSGPWGRTCLTSEPIPRHEIANASGGLVGRALRSVSRTAAPWRSPGSGARRCCRRGR
jgi:hypothetical protein